MPPDADRPPAPDLHELRDLAVELAEDAGALLLARLEEPRHHVDTKSSATDMVSDADRASEQRVVEGIRSSRPDDGILGEEGAQHGGTSGVRWVIDPLDGTTNFLYGFPAFAVSVAVEVDGRPTVGVVVDPLRRETYVGVRGAGATCNGKPLRVRPAPTLETALVGTGFSYEAERRRRQAGVLATVLPAVRDIRRAGAAALDLCWVAHGRLDAFYEKGLAPWDHAAGGLIAEEAGAQTGNLDGGSAGGDFTLAAPPVLFEALRSLLATAGADVA